MSIRNLLLGVAAITSSAFWLPAAASENGLDFALVFGHQEAPLLENGEPLELRYDTAAIRIAEISSLPVRLDISGGVLGARLRPDRRDSGIEFDGHFFGLRLGADYMLTHALFAGADMSYTYYSTEGANSSGKIGVDWRQTEARFLLGLQYESARIYGCARRINIDGETLVQTQATQTLELSERERNGACVGLQLETGDGGYIGVEWLNRNSDGLYLSFGRRYRD